MLVYLIIGIITLTEPCMCCPRDIIKKAQDCFADLASGVSKDDKVSLAGNLPLDYQRIKEYCEKDGHMSLFLVCVDKLLDQCRNQTESDVLHQLINPDKVRSSVPHLCENIEDIEVNAVCMNKQMNRNSDCKMAAYDLIRNGMSETTGNVTAMFNIQCHVLAECQRVAVAKECGEKLGDLHANFLLSFVPNTCSKNDLSSILLPRLRELTKTYPELKHIKINDKPLDGMEKTADDPTVKATHSVKSSQSKKTKDSEDFSVNLALSHQYDMMLFLCIILIGLRLLL